MFTFTFDHGVSDGAGGYGAVRVDTPNGDRWYIGRGFATTVLVERFPATELTYSEAAALTLWLAEGPSFSRSVTRDGGSTRHLITTRPAEPVSSY